MLTFDTFCKTFALAPNDYFAEGSREAGSLTALAHSIPAVSFFKPSFQTFRPC